VKASKKTKVFIIESESGWGQRVDETKTFSTLAKAEAFIKAYNEKYNNKRKVPDWYMYATL
jgi:hypothetical protein